MADLKLDHLFAAIGSAMYEAQQAINTNELNGYWRYFEQDPSLKTKNQQEGGENAEEANNVVAPVMRRLMIPYPEGGYREIQVPVVSLVNHNSFSLEQVKFRMNVKTTVDENTGALRVSVGPFRRKNCQDKQDNSVDHQEDLHEIELTFKRGDSSEGIARITQEITKLI